MATDCINEIDAGHHARLAGLDPMLGRPPLGPIDPTADTCEVATVQRRGRPVAAAVRRLDELDTSSPDAAWHPDRARTLILRSTTTPTLVADELLDALPAPAGDDGDVWDRALVAANDVGWTRALVDRGFVPGSVIAVRSQRAVDAALPPHIGFVRIRTATLDDLPQMLPLAAALQRFDAATGSIPQRPNPGALLAPRLAHDLEHHPGWAWVAERTGSIVGMCTVTPPPTSDWVTSCVNAEAVAYLGLVYVEPPLRTTRLGATLAARAHHRIAEEGISTSVLHHNPLNPLSTPFWARQGYRPLLTTWQRRPAHRLTTLRV